MLQSSEALFRLGVGVDTYNPAFSSSELKFTRVTNIEPVYNRLKTSNKHELYQTIAGDIDGPWKIVSFVNYPLQNLPAFQIYALAVHNLFVFNPAANNGAGQFEYILDENGDEEVFEYPSFIPFASVSWNDKVYITRPSEELGYLSERTYYRKSSNYEGTLSGRYMVESHGHLMLANTVENGKSEFLRVRWSDYEEPDDFEVLASNESDFYDLDGNAGFITGLSHQRGFTNIYAYNAIYRARYIPARTIAGILAPYVFEPLYTGIGNVFHHAMIQVKEIDYFFGNDNVYALDGQKLVPIGNDIWNFWLETNADVGYNESVYAHADEVNNQIFWLYPTNLEGYEYWSIVYNYKENKWSDRDPQNMFASWLPPLRPRTFLPIDTFTDEYGPIDDFNGLLDRGIPSDSDGWETTYIDGDWQFKLAPFKGLYGHDAVNDDYDAVIYGKSDLHAMFDESAMLCRFETFEFDFQSALNYKEINKAKLSFSEVGDVNVKMKVYTRSHPSETYRVSGELELNKQLQGERIFHFRNTGNGKYIKFEVYWENTDTNYVDELYFLSLVVSTPLSTGER